MSENPVIHLYDANYQGAVRRLRARQPRWTRWFALAALGYLTLLVASTVSTAYLEVGPRAALAVVLMELAGLGLLLGPASAGTGAQIGLQVVRKGRCLEEIFSTPITPTALLDGIVLASVRRLVPLGLKVWLVLLTGSVMLAGAYGWWPVLAAGLWFPVVLLLSFLAAIHRARWAVCGYYDWVGLVVMALALSVATGLLALLPEHWALLTLLPLGLGVTLGGTGLARRQAIARLGRVTEPAVRVRSTRVSAPVPEGNPLLAREAMRRQSWTWWGRHWEAAAALGLALLYTVPILAQNASSVGRPQPPFLPLFALCGVLVMTAPLRAVFRSLEVFQTDRQARSLEGLLMTRVSLAEAVEGAARLGWERPLREVGLLGLFLLPVAFWLQVIGFGWPGPEILVMTLVGLMTGVYFVVSMVLGASYLGVSAGLRCESRQEAWLKLGGQAFGGYILFVTACIPLAILQSRSFHVLGGALACGAFLLGPLGFVAWARAQAYRALRHSSTQVGFA